MRDRGFTKPCREYASCRHHKHGYTRKDRPVPALRVRPPKKSDEDIKALTQHHVCWCNTKKKPVEGA